MSNHDAVADEGEFGFDVCSGPCLIGSHTFNVAGTYSYICSVGNHAEQGMVGTVTVVDPTVSVTFSVDMNIEGVVGDVKVRTSTVNGEYSPSDWFVMDDSDGDMVYTYTMSLLPGFTYGYNFNNSDGSGYESLTSYFSATSDHRMGCLTLHSIFSKTSLLCPFDSPGQLN